MTNLTSCWYCDDKLIPQKTQTTKTQPIWNNLNSSKTIKEIEFVILEFPPTKSLGTNGFPGEIYQKMQGKMKPILHNPFHQTEKEGILLNLFDKGSITLILKPNEYST